MAVALFTVTLTSCALTALSVYADAVADAGLRRVLQDRSSARALLEVEADVDAAGRARLDALVRDTARDAFDGLPVRVAAVTRSGPYRLPDGERSERRGADGADDPRLTLLAALDASRVTFTAGTRPGPAEAEGAVPVAVPEAAARALDLRPGDRATLADRRHGPPLRIRVTGVYRPVDRNAPYWRLDPLAGRGVRTVGFTTYGPMLVDPSVFDAERVAPAAMSWQARADFSTVTADRADRLRESVRRAVARLGDDPAGASAQVDTDLPDLLSETERSLLVSRSTVLVGAAQLAALAGCVTVLVAGALNERRAAENALLRARGGSRRRIVALAAGEALLLVLPATIVSVAAAVPLAELSAEHGALARAGVRVLGTVDGGTRAVAAAVALGSAAVLIAPALRRPGVHVRERAARTRRPALGAAVRAGADLGLLAVAAVAYGRLSRQAAGGGVLSGADGTLGVDPVLVVAPACCLLAGAVATARLLPLVVRAGRWTADRGRGLVLACVHWQVSRRTGRVAGPLLLGVLAVATAVFAAGQGASWDRSRQDRADYAVGADLRVAGGSTPRFGQGGVYDEVAGIASATPVARERVMPAGDGTATVLAMDTARAPDIVRLREDLTDRPLDRLLAPLRPDARQRSGLVLPDDARRVRLAVRLRADGDAGRDGTDGPRATLGAVVEDRYGVPHAFALDDLPADGEPHVVELDFADAAGPAGAPAGPLRLTRLTAEHTLPERPRDLRLTVTELRTVDGDGDTTAVDVPGNADWEARARVENPAFRHAPAQGYVAARAHAPAVDRGGNVFDVRYGSGAEPAPPLGRAPSRGVLTLYAAEPSRPHLTAVATDAFLRANGTEVGDTITVDLSGASLEVRVTGSVRGLPTTPLRGGDAEGGALLTDLGALEDALLAHSAEPVEPGEWWLAAEPGRARQVAETLRARPDETSVLVRDEHAREAAADPLGAGPRAALPAVALAAAVLAAAGFAVVTVGALRERADDIAVLRALGARRSRIVAALAVEQGLLAAAAVGLGALVGTVATHLVVPLITVTAEASPPEPDVRVAFPFWLAVALAVAVPAVPAAVSAAVAARSGRPAAPRKAEE
ncbi:FtsX-like permease family protein [Streptomyces macrosporus]|uniref:FtsX-like permease family protein n=1 Tax=Streptomyces macrosporus TaxID=44032 RepID=UPI0031CEAE74